MAGKLVDSSRTSKLHLDCRAQKKKKWGKKNGEKIHMNFPDAATRTFRNVVHHFLVLFEKVCNHPVVGLIILEVACK